MVMKSAKSLLKRIRKGMTLLELIVAMALTSIIFVGAGTALFAMNRVSQKETKNHTCLTEAKTLMSLMDQTIKNKELEVFTVPSDADEVGKESCGVLFTIGTTNYGFDKKSFGVVVENKIESQNVKYTSTYEMYISRTKQVGNKFVEFVIHYGNNYENAISLVEVLEGQG